MKSLNLPSRAALGLSSSALGSHGSFLTMVTSQPVKVMALGLPGEGILLQGLALPPVVLCRWVEPLPHQGRGNGGGPQAVISPQAPPSAGQVAFGPSAPPSQPPHPRPVRAAPAQCPDSSQSPGTGPSEHRGRLDELSRRPGTLLWCVTLGSPEGPSLRPWHPAPSRTHKEQHSCLFKGVPPGRSRAGGLRPERGLRERRGTEVKSS